MRVELLELTGNSVLAGTVTGRSVFAALINAAKLEPSTPAPLFIDFNGVDVATASFLRESLFALKEHMRTIGSNHYPVAANVSEEILDELAVLTGARGDAIMSCHLDDSDTVSGANLVGNLDPKQAMTFELVQTLGSADANSLMAEFGDAEKTKSTTAWNNRLAALVGKGIVREFSQGRAKCYRPVLEEVV